MLSRNICLLNDSFPPLIDGVANTVVNYAKCLQKNGDNPYVVTPEYPGASDSHIEYPVIRYPGLDVRKLVGYIAGNPFSPKVFRELGDTKIDLLHSHCPAASTLLARNMREILNAPIVLTYHTKFDIDISKAIKGKLFQESALKALVDNVTAADEVWVVSEGAGRNLHEIGYRGDYIVMPNGVDVPKRRLSDAEVFKYTHMYNCPDGVPVFLFVGRIMWYKGLKIIIDALNALKSQDIDFRMFFAGNGTDIDEVKAYVNKLGLDGKITFLGAITDREELCAWYCKADLFLFPSTFDTNGLVVREAAACGLASVLVRGCCAAEGVTHMQNGFLIDENAASLAVLLVKIADRKDLMRTVGVNACDELYMSWTDSVKIARDRYETVIDNYKCGKYNRKFRPTDEFFKISGDLIDFFIETENKFQRY